MYVIRIVDIVIYARHCHHIYTYTQTAHSIKAYEMEFFKCGEIYRNAESKLAYTCFLCSDEFTTAIEFEDHISVHFSDVDDDAIEIDDDEQDTSATIKIETLEDEFIIENHDDETEYDEQYEIIETEEGDEYFDGVEVLEMDNNSDKVIRCNCCAEYFPCLGLMEKKHRKKEDPKKKCNDCAAYFEKPHDLASHRKIHALPSLYKCSHCAIMFASEADLMVHTVPTEQKKTSTAAAAATKVKATPTKRKREDTENEATADDAEQEIDGEMDEEDEDYLPRSDGSNNGKGRNRYKCHLCEKEYTYLHYLKQHLKKHKDNTLMHACDVCGHEFKLRQNLLAHKRVHTGEKPYVCKLCGKSFNQPYYMTVHMRIHQKQKPYACELCGVAFVTSSHLGRHMKSHNNIKPHKCNLCEKAFILPGHLNDHIRSQHTGERPFGCEVRFIIHVIVDVSNWRRFVVLDMRQHILTAQTITSTHATPW